MPDVDIRIVGLSHYGAENLVQQGAILCSFYTTTDAGADCRREFTLLPLNIPTLFTDHR
jgi:hypothetical protein